MPKDDIDMEGEEECGDSACVHLHCWALRGRVLGFEKGQQNPSPETVKKIEAEAVDEFRESLEEAIEKAWMSGKGGLARWMRLEEITAIIRSHDKEGESP